MNFWTKGFIKNIAIVMVLAMLVGFGASLSFAEEKNNVDAPKLMIHQVYGGGGKGDTPFTHSFIELYNAGEEGIDLEGYSLEYSSNRDAKHAGSTIVDNVVKIDTLELKGSIPAKGSYLIRGAAEATSLAKYSLNIFDQEWDRVIDNDKNVVVKLLIGEDYVDGFSTRTGEALLEEGSTLAATQVSKQRSFRRISFSDSNNNASDFETLTWNDDVVDNRFISLYRPRSLSEGSWSIGGGEEAGFNAHSLTLAPGRNNSELNINWYADDIEAKGVIKVNNKEFSAVKASASEGFVHMKALITGLEPSMYYTYKVSNDGGESYSREYSFTTPSKDTFSFGFVGDPQLRLNRFDENNTWVTEEENRNSLYGWQKTVEKMMEAKVDIIVSGGDQVDKSTGDEKEYDWFFNPDGLRSVPFAPVIGNHDRHLLFNYHFNIPNEVDVTDILNVENAPDATAPNAQNGNYYYLYNNVLFVGLNTSSSPKSIDNAKPFIEAYDRTITQAKKSFEGQYQWLIVHHHKSTASVATHVADLDLKHYVGAGFESLMDKHGVDLVLAGHDHVYARSYPMKDGVRQGELSNNMNDPKGTIYITGNSSSGMKYYKVFSLSSSRLVKENNQYLEYPFLFDGTTGAIEYMKEKLPLSTAVYEQNFTPNYSVGEVSGNKLIFSTYRINSSEAIDSFTIT